MKRPIIAVLIGAIILFVWQFISHMMMGETLHKINGLAPDAEKQVLAGLAQTEDGVYMIPAPNYKATMAEHEEMMKQCLGKPWATISYHNKMENNMVSSMVVGFILDLLGVLIVVGAMGMARERLYSFGRRWWMVLMFGLFLIVMSTLMMWNWYGWPTNLSMMDALDTLIAWGLVGLWLAWYLGKGMAPNQPATM